MRAFQLQDNRGFMKKLLLEETFDSFLLSEASITTFATVQIDGSFHPDYFPSDEAEQLTTERCGYALWKRVRPFFFQLTKGKNTPLRFRLIFRLAPHQLEQLLSAGGLSLRAEQVDGLFLNISFDGSSITCTSGTALRFFSLDKSLERTWDEALENFFRRKQIPFL